MGLYRALMIGQRTSIKYLKGIATISHPLIPKSILESWMINSQ